MVEYKQYYAIINSSFEVITFTTKEYENDNKLRCVIDTLNKYGFISDKSFNDIKHYLSYDNDNEKDYIKYLDSKFCLNICNYDNNYKNFDKNKDSKLTGGNITNLQWYIYKKDDEELYNKLYYPVLLQTTTDESRHASSFKDVGIINLEYKDNIYNISYYLKLKTKRKFDKTSDYAKTYYSVASANTCVKVCRPPEVNILPYIIKTNKDTPINENLFFQEYKQFIQSDSTVQPSSFEPSSEQSDSIVQPSTSEPSSKQSDSIVQSSSFEPSSKQSDSIVQSSSFEPSSKQSDSIVQPSTSETSSEQSDLIVQPSTSETQQQSNIYIGGFCGDMKGNVNTHIIYHFTFHNAIVEYTTNPRTGSSLVNIIKEKKERTSRINFVLYIIPSRYYYNMSQCIYKIPLKSVIIDTENDSPIIRDITNYKSFIERVYQLLTNNGSNNETNFPNKNGNRYILSFRDHNIILSSQIDDEKDEVMQLEVMQLYNICNINNYINHNCIVNNTCNAETKTKDIYTYLLRKFNEYYTDEKKEISLNQDCLFLHNVVDFNEVVTKKIDTINFNNMFDSKHYPDTNKNLKIKKTPSSSIPLPPINTACNLPKINELNKDEQKAMIVINSLDKKQSTVEINNPKCIDSIFDEDLFKTKIIEFVDKNYEDINKIINEKDIKDFDGLDHKFTNKRAILYFKNYITTNVINKYKDSVTVPDNFTTTNKKSYKTDESKKIAYCIQECKCDKKDPTLEKCIFNKIVIIIRNYINKLQTEQPSAQPITDYKLEYKKQVMNQVIKQFIEELTKEPESIPKQPTNSGGNNSNISLNQIYKSYQQKYNLF